MTHPAPPNTMQRHILRNRHNYTDAQIDVLGTHKAAQAELNRLDGNVVPQNERKRVSAGTAMFSAKGGKA